MILSPAQYLLRIDDLCPTVSAERWQQFQSLIEEFRLILSWPWFPIIRTRNYRFPRPIRPSWMACALCRPQDLRSASTDIVMYAQAVAAA